MVARQRAEVAAVGPVSGLATVRPDRARWETAPVVIAGGRHRAADRPRHVWAADQVAATARDGVGTREATVGAAVDLVAGGMGRVVPEAINARMM